MREANLGGAFLTNADLIGELSVASDLEGATMPDGQKYEDWLKSKGKWEHGENTGPS
jgi:uncharacterized protein YjbI with pentapeptide repeats